jgi:membrane-associated phospholipid phosphatase
MKKVTAKAVLFLFALAVVISFFVALQKLRGFDLSAMIIIQNLIPKSWDTFLSVLSLVGSAEIITIIFLALVFTKLIDKDKGIIAQLFKWKNWNIKFFSKLAKDEYLSVICLGLYFAGFVVELLGKTLIHHPTPPDTFFRFNLSFLFPSSYVQTGYSFPSGHALRTAFLAVFLGNLIYLNKKITPRVRFSAIAGIAVFTFLMLLSRVSLGEHWTTDVVVGASIGAGLGLTAVQALTAPKKSSK